MNANVGWRRSQRERLITARLAVPASKRKQVADEVAEVLDDVIDFTSAPIVSLYWPIRGELNLRDWMHTAYARGATIALPVYEYGCLYMAISTMALFDVCIQTWQLELHRVPGLNT